MGTKVSLGGQEEGECAGRVEEGQGSSFEYWDLHVSS